ncbi:similar to An12g04130 [Aspergillus luchuensis]|uniref:Similar to An12g04130 n=1 Tax=Aspergillus kawachii TaxID=1069201 RepID=A0A146FNF2_ASPKA|nr:similar to An12g04130 [Aspergillus luchuensis]
MSHYNERPKSPTTFDGHTLDDRQQQYTPAAREPHDTQNVSISPPRIPDSSDSPPVIDFPLNVFHFYMEGSFCSK